jgi:ABC-2 type transport system permease protein
MRYSLYQEYYKLIHKKITWFAPLIVLVLMGLSAIVFGTGGGRWTVMASYASSLIIELVLVIVGSSIFSMEFQNNAILTLLYKAPSKINVYLSKFIVIFVYDLFLHALAILFTFAIKATQVTGNFSWFAIYKYHQSLLVNMLMTIGVQLIMTLLVIALIFVISCVINVSSVAMLVNFVVVFMGQNFSDDIMNNAGSHLTWLARWNPFNMLHLMMQYANYSEYREITQLSNLQLSLGTLGYTAIFFGIGYLIFRRKRF